MKLFKLSSVTMITLLFTQVSFAGGISSSGPLDPHSAILQRFIDDPAANKEASDLEAMGYSQVSTPSLSVVGGTCARETPEGYAGRCITQYLISVSFIAPKGADPSYRFVSATYVVDNYDKVPGVQAQTKYQTISEKILQKVASLLNQ